MKKTAALLLFIALTIVAFSTIRAQDAVTEQPTQEDLAKQKAELEKNAYRLLDQVIDEAQSLRLLENRVRVDINAADLLWDHNQERARSIFAMAADGVAELVRSNATAGNQRGLAPPERRTFSLRQELVLAAARHDASLAYQLLAATKSQVPASTPQTDFRNPRMQFNVDDTLEQTLLARVAALDPKLAAQNAEQMMEKGQFPRTVGDVINQLQRQDPEAAAKLADKTVKRIQSANLLTNNEASNLAQALINVGPRVVAPVSTQSLDANAQQQPKPSTAARGPVLEVQQYTDLLSTLVDAALKATPQAQTNQRGQGRGPGNRITVINQNNQGTQITDTQIEQNNARRLLVGLRNSLTAIDQYLPGRSSAVRQKLTELGISDNSRQNFAQIWNSMQQGDVDAESLVRAAASAPQQLQSRIYQQAAVKALEAGNTDQARQIANDHLQSSARDSIMQRIDFREMAKKADGIRLDEIRQNVSRLQSDTEKVSLLLQLANDLQKDNPKAQLQLLEEARQIISHRATNYDQFEDQLHVAEAFISVDPARSFEILEPGISQLNELLMAASVLSGFELNMFRDGEMAINQGGNGLSSTITRYGQELAILSKTDFNRSETLAGRFQFTEARVMARLSIIQGALGVQPTTQPTVNMFRNFGGNFLGRPN